MLEKHSSRMSYSYLLNATNCFSEDNVIGLGKLATLYKAAIGNVGIARGLAWLHHNCNYRVTHGNICSKFIFLDKQFNPKISSFGGTRIVGSNSGNVRMRICEKSDFRESDDVYAFGILLVEVITGEKPEDVSNLCEGFDGTLIGGNLRNAIDSSLIGKGFDSEICQVLQVALDCIGLSSNGRPTMLEVYRCLSSIGAKKESAYTFGKSNQIGDGGGTHMAEHSGIDIIEEVE
ncbi:hypothetical protein RHSIM_Rhsim09G0006500 [Rhododendron simsii]|uniref:Protein kinase domain-containing protein n=1 Tax=Rhododendron simsii TaxID=118357 RepID=A0A834GJN2_RHOSS|nr:hypothetical protein RHSIM_Rhsim09G0006500 [Rhododendron simsii]